MSRALILLVLVTSLCVIAIATAIRPAVGRTADRHQPLVEGVSPRFETLAMTII